MKTNYQGAPKGLKQQDLTP
jgi:hypothetical protein